MVSLTKPKATKTELLQIRNELFDKLPSGEVNAWDLITAIKEHLSELDKLIDSAPDSKTLELNSIEAWNLEAQIPTLSDFKDEVAKQYGHVNFAAVKNKYRRETLHVGDLIAFVDEANKRFYSLSRNKEEWVSCDFETVQSDLNKNFNNIRMGAEHTLYLNNKYEVRLLPTTPKS